jgi:hypothetical protein
MQIIYVLQAQGLGDNEYEFYNVGVYSSVAKLEAAKQNFINEWDAGGLEDVELNVEQYEVDANA